jgi:hypothetical protein
MDIAVGEDLLDSCDQKSPYKHVSDFPQLCSFVRLELRTQGKDYRKQMEQNNRQSIIPNKFKV